MADDYIQAVAKVMALANWHTYQVLTKRSERMRDLLRTKLKDVAALPHIWWGVSVENKKHGLPRIDHLRQASAAVPESSAARQERLAMIERALTVEGFCGRNTSTSFADH